MPKLLAFLPCEKVLFGTDNSASLIVLIHEVTYGSPPPDPFPDRGLVPFRWQVFAQWNRIREDGGHTFAQRVQLMDGNRECFSQVTEIPLTHPVNRVVGAFEFFPLLRAGEYDLVLSIRDTTTQEWTESARHPIRVVYAQPLG